MTKPEQLRDAFEKADAIMALEGFARTEDQARRQQLVIAGVLSFDEAVGQAIAEAQAKAGDDGRAQRQRAVDSAAAIMALEGFTGGAGIEDLKAKVVDGSMTFDEAVREALARAREGRSQ
jgi:hypothetical protein